MTLGTITLFAITGSMFAIKLAIMIFAVVLLAKALSSRQIRLAPFPATSSLPRQKDSGLWRPIRDPGPWQHDSGQDLQ